MNLHRLRARLERLERRNRARYHCVDPDFKIDPVVAKSLRDNDRRLEEIFETDLEEAERLRASIAARARAIDCPMTYGPIRAKQDGNRRYQLWAKTVSPVHCGGGPLSAAEDAEEAQVIARLLVFEHRPEERKNSAAEQKEREYLWRNNPMRESIEAWRRVAGRTRQ